MKRELEGGGGGGLSKDQSTVMAFNSCQKLHQGPESK